jgi:hypothetical protein
MPLFTDYDLQTGLKPADWPRIFVGLVNALLSTGGGANVGAINTRDGGPQQTLTRTYTTSADMTTAAAISAQPEAGKKVVATDIVISTDTAMNFIVQMETSTNGLLKVFLPANGTVQITLRGYIKGDAADKRLFGKASVAGNVAITLVQFSET